MSSITRFLKQIDPSNQYTPVADLTLLAKKACEFISSNPSYQGNSPPGFIIPATSNLYGAIINFAGTSGLVAVLRDMGKTVFAPMATNPINGLAKAYLGAAYFQEVQLLLPAPIVYPPGFIGGPSGNAFGVVGSSPDTYTNYLTFYLPKTVDGIMGMFYSATDTNPTQGSTVYLTYNLNLPSGKSNPGITLPPSTSYAIGAVVDIIDNSSYSLDGYDFGGWCIDPTYATDDQTPDVYDSTDPTANTITLDSAGTIILYAIWYANASYTVVYDLNLPTGETISPSYAPLMPGLYSNSDTIIVPSLPTVDDNQYTCIGFSPEKDYFTYGNYLYYPDVYNPTNAEFMISDIDPSYVDDTDTLTMYAIWQSSIAPLMEISPMILPQSISPAAVYTGPNFSLSVTYFPNRGTPDWAVPPPQITNYSKGGSTSTTQQILYTISPANNNLTYTNGVITYTFGGWVSLDHLLPATRSSYNTNKGLLGIYPEMRRTATANGPQNWWMPGEQILLGLTVSGPNGPFMSASLFAVWIPTIVVNLSSAQAYNFLWSSGTGSWGARSTGTDIDNQLHIVSTGTPDNPRTNKRSYNSRSSDVDRFVGWSPSFKGNLTIAPNDIGSTIPIYGGAKISSTGISIADPLSTFSFPFSVTPTLTQWPASQITIGLGAVMATSSFIIIGYCSSGANATYIPTPHYVATGYYDPTTFMPKANPFTNQYGTFVGWSTVRNMTVSATGRTGLTATNFWAAGTAIPLGSKGLSKHTILYAVWDVLPKYVITVTFDPNIPAGTEAYAAAWGIVTTVQTKTFNTADGAPVLDIGGVPNFLSTFFITSIPRPSAPKLNDPQFKFIGWTLPQNGKGRVPAVPSSGPINTNGVFYPGNQVGSNATLYGFWASKSYTP